MKIIVITALLVFASFLSTTAQAKVCTMVTLGSSDIVPHGDRNLSLIAIERCDGTVKGQIQDVFFGGVSAHVDVTCLFVDGNDAWISGTIKHLNPAAFFPDFSGFPVVIRVRDNGKTANDPPDQVSFLTNGEDPLQDCLDMLDLPLFDLSNGQVQIR